VPNHNKYPQRSCYTIKEQLIIKESFRKEFSVEITK